MDKTVSEHLIVFARISHFKFSNCKVNHRSGMCLSEQGCVLSINLAIK